MEGNRTLYLFPSCLEGGEGRKGREGSFYRASVLLAWRRLHSGALLSFYWVASRHWKKKREKMIGVRGRAEGKETGRGRGRVEGGGGGGGETG